ncbi:MAG: ABC transporter substrate-binding protein [Limnochordales bacterium]|nr:ethanolamine utilization protein EutJ [Bacillota bacterium]
MSSLRGRNLVLAVALLLGTLVPASALAAVGEIVIGLNVELTGSIPVVGQSSLRGAQLAVDEVNSAGGLEVNGQRYRIRLVVEDNQDVAPSAAAAATKLITQDNVLAMVGPNASRMAIPAAIVANNLRTPMISPWSTAVETTVNRPYVFRAAFVDDFQGAVVARFAREVLGAQTAAVLFDIASDYNKGIAEIFRDRFTQLGGRIVAFESYTTGDRDFSSQLTRIRAANPDVLFLPNYYSEVPLQVQQARRLGYTGHILGSDSWAYEELLTLGGNLMEGLFFSAHYAPDIATPRAQQFIQAYQARYGSAPDDVAALTYDSFYLLFEAIQKAGRIDRDAVREALASIVDFEGVTGKMTFDGSGDPIKSAVIIQIRSGQFTYYASVDP